MIIYVVKSHIPNYPLVVPPPPPPLYSMHAMCHMSHSATNRQVESIKEALTRFMEALRSGASDTCEYPDTILHVHGPSASNASTHAHTDSRAHDEHADHTAGGNPDISHGILLVPCESGHTSGNREHRQRPRSQRTTDM